MVPNDQLKYVEEMLTPVLLYECTLVDGQIEYWSTHSATYEGVTYSPRILENTGFEIGLLADDGADWGNRISLVLANTDAYVTQLHQDQNLKGCQLLVQFAFLDPASGQVMATPQAVFTGIGDAPEQITTTKAKLNFSSRFSLQRLAVPQVRIQENCPWSFPQNAAQRAEAVSGGSAGLYSRFYPCGYSADQAGGCGNLQSDGTAYTSCDGSKTQCVARGMWSADASGNPTMRYGGFEFLPATSLVRSYGSAQRYWSQAIDGRARPNDAVPLVYGTVRFPAPVIWAWSDGNYLICEVLVGSGPIQGVQSLWVEGIQLPLGVAGVDMSATGWYNVVTTGSRNGAFDPNFMDSQGNPISDPHGSLAVLSVHVPSGLVSSNRLPTIEVLAQGLLLDRYDAQGNFLDQFFTNDPAWALLDLLRRCGWQDDEIDLGSFGNAAAYLDQLVAVTDENRNAIQEPVAAFNYALLDRKPAIDVVRGLRQGAELLVRLNQNGQISVMVEGTIAEQQPVQLACSNATASLNGGWPSFEANDGSTGACTILAGKDGDIALSLSCEPTSMTPNRLTVELQDSRNNYLNGSLSLVDSDDVARAGSEVPGIFRGLGIPSVTQAERVLSKELARDVDGNLFAEFSTTVKGLGMQPGDIIAITSSDYNLTRAPFRVLRLSLGLNFETIAVVAQTHDDSWYGPGSATSGTSSGWPSTAAAGTPFPIAGYTYDAGSGPALFIQEESEPEADGGASEVLFVQFRPPRQQVASLPAPGIEPTAVIAGSGQLQPGAKALYYAVTAVDGNGEESTVSQVIQVVTGAIETAFGVTLNGLAAPNGAAGMRVYRGDSAYDLLYLSDLDANLTTWTDTGGSVSPMRPPDPRYDHADFYWRTELTGELTVASIAGATLTIANASFTNGQFTGNALAAVSGNATGWQTTVATNTSTEITVNDPIPDGLAAGDFVVIADSSWRLAGRSYSDQITWEVPNRAGLPIEITGRSSTASGLEAPIEQSYLYRYTITGGAGSLLDSQLPPIAALDIEAPADGSLLLQNITTQTLSGTVTVASAILVTYSVDETEIPVTFALAAALEPGDLTLPVVQGLTLGQNTYLQVDTEIIRVGAPTTDGSAYEIDRGIAGTAAATHANGALATVLERNLQVVPLGTGFFSNQTNTNFQYRILFPDQRIAGSEFYLENALGTGPGDDTSYLQNGQNGLHTFDGGTIVLQTAGDLSIERDASNSIVLDRTRVVRDVQAFVDSAPSGGSATIVLNADGQPIATLIIADGSVQATPFIPAATLRLVEGAKLNYDIAAVPQGANTSSGQNLSVQIRT
ncbi:MAG: phage tail protein [Bryobacteraceae bacterium]